MEQTSKLKVIRIEPDAFYSIEGAAEVLGRSVKTMHTLRSRGGGPAYHKRGRIVTYRGQALIDWISGASFISTSDEASR